MERTAGKNEGKIHAFRASSTAIRERVLGMKRVLEALRNLPPGAVWLFASALLAILGAANASLHGLHQMAQIGFVGAIVAMAVVWGFCDWSRPPSIGRR